MTRLQPRLAFIPQDLNLIVLWLTQRIIPLLLRLRLRSWLPSGISHIQVNHIEILVNLYQQFQAGKIRFLMAFRHPEVDDPLCMFYVLSRLVPEAARQQGVALKFPVHTHFVYDRGMPLWAGWLLGWFFSRLGGIPIHRGKRPDRTGLRVARELFVNGQLPIAIAPEGATNGHSELVSPLEPGVAQLSFWCLEDLAKAQRQETVFIVPVSIRYHYPRPPWGNLDKLLRQLEQDTGLPTPPPPPGADQTPFFYKRLFHLGEHVLSEMEDFYRRFYHQELPVLDPSHYEDENALLAARLQRLLNIALQVAETYFAIAPQGNLSERCRRIEEAGWRYIYREEIKSQAELESLSPFTRGLGDWVAQEAVIRMRHMRLVESFVAVTGTYVREKPSIERLAETTLILFDMIARVKGEELPCRPRLGWRHATITIGNPLSVSDRWHTYQSSRSAARQAVAELTQDLQRALEAMVEKGGVAE
ncbi:1-acyl-sn-glycerol-3-phosphate acyltransferase [Leptothermofonsia sichuanensis E412]|uniref:lysophospholipid acyltransferase family protein n=1 Tax=Leptothermofonsia sichuanensis TaxID=2917832 RepID=UPI001CA7964D|nr:1-acyl-sn-glycerol-3-phosphate acyltransferase [Leptothermofonsia sichuanensis]QZZ19852.1 1-acyl-sn-glycerol-3-phosphate acyltransferase [Leptothermofonsia sichuanensis E412]